MSDGYLNKCKACAKKDVQKNYRDNKEYYQEYERIRSKTLKRKRQKLLYEKKSRIKFPGKAKAREAVAYALKKGILVKENCFYCGDTNTEAHHNDYRKKLDIKWVCFRCHRVKEHGQQQ